MDRYLNKKDIILIHFLQFKGRMTHYYSYLKIKKNNFIDQE